MTTNVQSSNSLTNKLYNTALYLESSRIHTFTNLMTDGAPTMGTEGKKLKGQSSPGAPIIRINDLSEGAGDTVYYDLFHQLRQKPVMGDKKLAGKGASLKYASDSLVIDQGRTMVDSGGRMSQQRTKHDLRKVAKQLLTPYYGVLQDQLTLVHLAGARGSHNDADWIVPLASDAEFGEIVVNPILPPTYDRTVWAADATGPADLASGDKFTLDEVDKLRLKLDLMAFPLQPIKYKDDPQAEDNPFYILMVTPTQWNDFWTGTDGDTMRTLQSNARARTAGWKNSIFTGDCVMWNNILIKKQRRPIRFNAGDTVTVCTDSVDASTTTATAAVNFERAILLGAQALADAYGHSKSGRGSLPFAWNEEETDHKNVMEHSIAWINGKKKIRFKGTDGRVNDHGVMVLNTAVSA